MRSHKTIIVLFLLLLTSVGCLRYVPTRKEIQAKYQGRSGENAEQDLAGPDAFQAYELDLDERLKKLRDERIPLLTSPSSSSYKLGSGDLIEIDVFGLPELHSETVIDVNGMAQLPLLGTLPAKGMSLEEFKEGITAGLAKYVKRPNPKVTIKEFGGHKVTVTGSVIKPGVYSLIREGETLMEVLSRAGGRSEKAGTRVILLPAVSNRVDGDVQNLQATSEIGVDIDVDDLIGGINHRPLAIPLLAGDTIVVPEMGAVKVDGEVVKGGSFPLTAKTSTLGAVAAAGGLTYSANVHEVEVIREIGAGRKAYATVDLERVGLNGVKDIVLRDGDIVRVPSATGKFTTRQIVESLNGIFRGGVSGQVRY